MNYFKIYFILILNIFPLFGCQQSNKATIENDIKSYINDFELIHENKKNQTSIKITSPAAIINSKNNDIEITKSTIEIINNNSQDIKVKSGNSILNNFTNSIHVLNNVKISFLNSKDYFITTNSFTWDLKNSVMYIDKPLKINFNNSNIVANNGLYNIDAGLLKIDNTEFNRNLYNSEGKEKYQINIKSDFAKWLKNENTLVFISNEKQIETTINLLLTE